MLVDKNVVIPLQKSRTPVSPLVLMWIKTHMGKKQNTIKHRTQESQVYSHFPAGNHKAAKSTQGRFIKINIKHNHQKKDPQKKHHLGTVSKKSLEGLYISDGTNITLAVESI